MRFVPLIAAALPILVFGQRDIPVFRAETTLATVRFHVVQKKHYVDDLKREDIVVLEDGVPRNLTLFEGGRLTRRTIPVELSLVFDISGSVTQEGLLDPLVFKTTVLDGLGNVRLSVYGFDSNLKRFCRPTQDFEELKSCLSRVQNYRGGAKPRPEVIPVQLPPKRKPDPRGGTWIYEAVRAAAKDAAAGEANVTRMILVFSDGFPTTNTRPEDVAPAINEYGIPVYPVVLGHERIKQQIKQVMETGRNQQGILNDGARNRMTHLEGQQRLIEEFAMLGELTGGRSFDPPFINLLMMRQILMFMVGQVQCEFVVGFSPEASSGQPKKHKIEVKLRSKELGKVLGGTRTVVH